MIWLIRSLIKDIISLSAAFIISTVIQYWPTTFPDFVLLVIFATMCFLASIGGPWMVDCFGNCSSYHLNSLFKTGLTGNFHNCCFSSFGMDNLQFSFRTHLSLIVSFFRSFFFLAISKISLLSFDCFVLVNLLSFAPHFAIPSTFPADFWGSR